MIFNDLLAGTDEILNSTTTIVYCSVIKDCCASMVTLLITSISVLNGIIYLLLLHFQIVF